MSTPLNKELSEIIAKMTDILVRREEAIRKDLAYWTFQPESLERLAKLAVINVKKKQIEAIKKDFSGIMKGSENRIILSVMDQFDN